jgi:hypothetical protein
VPEPNPFILPSGTAAGSFMAVISGKVVDSFGPIGKFAMIACMYTIFATCIQFVPDSSCRTVRAGDLRQVAREFERKRLACNLHLSLPRRLAIEASSPHQSQ